MQIAIPNLTPAVVTAASGGGQCCRYEAREVRAP